MMGVCTLLGRVVRLFRREPALYAVECRWCQLYKGSTAEPAIVGWSLVPGSSGICPECRLRFEAEAVADGVLHRGGRGVTQREKP